MGATRSRWKNSDLISAERTQNKKHSISQFDKTIIDLV